MIASSFLHSLPAAVHPHEPARHLTTALAGAVIRTLRHRPCRAFGVTCSVGFWFVPAEGALFRALRLPGLERLACHGWPLLLGDLSFRIRSCLQALTVCIVVPCRASLIRLRPIRPHHSSPSVTLTSSHGGLFKCGQKLPGNEQ